MFKNEEDLNPENWTDEQKDNVMNFLFTNENEEEEYDKMAEQAFEEFQNDLNRDAILNPINFKKAIRALKIVRALTEDNNGTEVSYYCTPSLLDATITGVSFLNAFSITSNNMVLLNELSTLADKIVFWSKASNKGCVSIEVEINDVWTPIK